MSFYDEAHLAKDEFGANLTYVFKTLTIPRALANKTKPTFVFMSATSDDPQTLAGILASCPATSVRVISRVGGAREEYVSVYKSSDRCGRKADHPLDHESLYKVWTEQMPGEKGNLLIFFKDEDGLRLRLLNRHNFPDDASVISFHQSKTEIWEFERELRNLKGQSNLFCSHTANHGQLPRLLRAVSSGNRTILASSALHTGQNVPRTICVIAPAVRDVSASLRQPVARAGRDGKGVGLISCNDEELERRILEDPGDYLLKTKSPIRIPVQGASSYYKGAYRYLKVLREVVRSAGTYDENWLESSWLEFFVKNLPPPPTVSALLLDQLNGKTIENALAFFRQRYADSLDVLEVEVGPLLSSLREIERKVPVMDIDSNITIAEVTVMEAFRDWFPSFCRPSIHNPTTLWEWADAEMVEELSTNDGGTSKITIDNLTKIYVKQTRNFANINPKNGRCHTTVENCRQISKRKLDLVTLEVEEVEIVTRFLGFIGGSKELEEPPALKFQTLLIDIWRKDSQLHQKARRCSLSIDFENYLTRNAATITACTIVFIEERYNISEACFSVGYCAEKDRVEICENAKGRALGLGKLIEEDQKFTRDWLESLISER